MKSGGRGARSRGCRGVSHTSTFTKTVGNSIACRYMLALRSSFVGNRSSFVGNSGTFSSRW